MTTIVEVLVQGDPADPFRYGWRYVRRPGPDGGERWERVPLTLADVLHPQEGDQVIQDQAHGRRCGYLVDIFEARLAADPTAAVLHDVRIRWDHPELEPHGPDIAVVLGLRRKQDWRSFDVAAEGVRPALIVEVTSPTTAAVDRLTKLAEYELAGVPLYVIVDGVTRGQLSPPRLLGYRLVGDRYQVLAPDAAGRLWLETVGVWLGVEDEEVVCRDAAGRALGNYQSLTAELAAERQALAAEQQARLAEQQATATRIAALEAEIRRLRSEDGQTSGAGGEQGRP